MRCPLASTLSLRTCLSVLLAAPTLAAPQSRELTHQRPAGFAWTFEERSVLTLDLRFTGGRQDIEARQVLEEVFRGAASVSAATAGDATRVKVDFAPGCGAKSTVQGQLEETPSPLAGQSLEAALQGERVTALDGPGARSLDDAARRTVEQLVVIDRALVPARALEVGATWRANPPRGAEELRPDLEVRVVGFAERAGRPAAELACKGKLSGAPGGLGLEADVEGRLLVDLASGLVLESRISGPLTASGEVDNGGTKLRVKGTGRVEFTSSAVVGPAGQPQASGEGLDGAWTGADGVAADVHGDLVLLRRGAEGYAGRLAERREGSARGEFAAGGALHPFELRAAGRDVVTLHTGGLALELRRAPRAAGAGNPFGGAVAAPPTPPVADGRADWVEYAHPAGTSLRHPPKWKTEVSALGATLVPDGSDRNTEAILAFGDAAGVETDPLGPHAVATMDGLVRGALPGFTRRGAPTELLLPSGKAGVYEYRGRGPDGRALRCRVLARVVGGAALGLSHVASDELVERRRKDLEAVFDTFGYGAPKPVAAGGGKASTDDPRLIGAFAGEALAGGGDRGVYVNTQLLYVLNSDGTALNGARSALNASQRDSAGNLLWTANGETAASVLRGAWSARQGTLTIDWQGQGRTVVRYGFEPDGTLALRDAASGKLINIYTRVQ